MLRRIAKPALLFILAGAAGMAIYRTSEPVAVRAGSDAPATASVAEDASQLTVPGRPAEDAFGLVGDVAMAPGGRTIVLDVLNGEVSLFDGKGRRAALLGQAGPGPGEFLGPVALAVDDAEGGLYVLDERKQGLDEFNERGEWRRTVPHPRSLDSA